jgi:uracil-DNA glycosylase
MRQIGESRDTRNAAHAPPVAVGDDDAESLVARISICRLCAPDFAATATAHAPRPVPWFRSGVRLLIAGQAPGARVHDSGRPFDDPSGARLRAWLGLTLDEFYDRSRVAFAPMAFCFPGYDAKGTDLPPPPRCAATWRAGVMAALGPVPLALLVGGHAQKWHLGTGAAAGVSATVAGWQAHVPHVFPLPHPSWRNTGWLRRNPWFGDALLPALRARVREVMYDR